MKDLINRRLEIKDKINILVKEKDENKKLVGTKFEETGVAANKEIDGKLNELNRELDLICELIFDEITKINKNNFSLIGNELGVSVNTDKSEKVSLEEYSLKAIENLNSIFSSSKEFRDLFVKYSKEGYLTLTSGRSDYPDYLSLFLEDEKLVFQLTGYANHDTDFSDDYSPYGNSNIFEKKYVIKLLENKEAAVRFFSQLFLEIERKKFSRY